MKKVRKLPNRPIRDTRNKRHEIRFQYLQKTNTAIHITQVYNKNIKNKTRQKKIKEQLKFMKLNLINQKQPISKASISQNDQEIIQQLIGRNTSYPYTVYN